MGRKKTQEKSTPHKNKQTEQCEPEKQNLGIIKNYLNHPQHTRLEHRQRHHQALV